MTESEREEILKDIKDGYIDDWDNLTIDELFKEIEKEHKEIQQYRAIGTVEEFSALKHFESNYEHNMTESEALEELKIFPINCLDFKENQALQVATKALEKQIPKKPIYSKFDDNGNDEIIPYKAICPVCKNEFEFGTWNEEENHHCKCGQKVDWSK